MNYVRRYYLTLIGLAITVIATVAVILIVAG